MIQNKQLVYKAKILNKLKIGGVIYESGIVLESTRQPNETYFIYEHENQIYQIPKENVDIVLYLRVSFVITETYDLPLG